MKDIPEDNPKTEKSLEPIDPLASDRLEAFEAKRRPPKWKDVESLSFKVGLFESTGTTDMGVTGHLIEATVRTIEKTKSADKQEETVRHVNQALAMLHGIGPKDELEGMLAAQMVGVHNLAVQFMAAAVHKDQTVDGAERNINRVVKLTRTFTAQMEALNRHRGKGQQKMTVEHVHIHNGGQAVIGSVTKGGGEG